MSGSIMTMNKLSIETILFDYCLLSLMENKSKKINGKVWLIYKIPWIRNWDLV